MLMDRVIEFITSIPAWQVGLIVGFWLGLTWYFGYLMGFMNGLDEWKRPDSTTYKLLNKTVYKKKTK